MDIIALGCLFSLSALTDKVLLHNASVHNTNCAHFSLSTNLYICANIRTYVLTCVYSTHIHTYIGCTYVCACCVWIHTYFHCLYIHCIRGCKTMGCGVHTYVCVYVLYILSLCYVCIMVHCTMNGAMQVGYMYTGTLRWVHVQAGSQCIRHWQLLY